MKRFAAIGAALLALATLASTPAQAATPKPFAFKLHAVNQAGGEFACEQGWGVFSGPTDAASIAVKKSWGINAVRLPLNEDCELGLHGVSPTYSGLNYRNAVHAYVSRLRAAGMYTILDLHWSTHDGTLAKGQDLMADRAHSATFWKTVAADYKNDPQVAFDLFNEPNHINWTTWRDGDATYVGMNQLIAAVRSTGATNWVIASGLEWANDMRSWLTHKPTDPLNKLAAGTHIYNFNRCVTVTCWNTEIRPILAVAPIFITEMGTNTCTGTFPKTVLDWAYQTGIAGMAPWAWNASFTCTGGPSLITTSSGTPTVYGQAVKTWFQTHAP